MKTELFCSVFKKICFHTYRFHIVFARPHYNAVSVLKTLLCPQCACSNELDACAFQYIGPRNWREIEATWKRLSANLDAHGRVIWPPVVSILITSPFSDSIVFSVHTAFSKYIVFKSLHPGERFRLAPFSVIVFGIVVWTIAVSETK